MSRLMLSLVMTALVGGAWAAAEAPARPNIVFILADDLGWTDTGVYGSRYYETPNIDRFASQGVRMLNHHHCQNCTPTRAALMGGQYGARTGVYTVGGADRFDTSMRPLVPVANVTELPLDRATIAQQLKLAGYATGMFCKWHIGQKGDYAPGKRGFDEAIETMGRHFDFVTEPRTEYPKGQYLADFLTGRAVDFIRRHKDAPFFLYLPHYGVHSPYDAKPELVEFFEDGRLELYNLRDDLGETNNLANKMPEKVQDLHAKMRAWRESIHAPLPSPKTGDIAHGKVRPKKRNRRVGE